MRRTIVSLIHSRLVNFALGIFLAALWSVFAYTHIKAYLSSGFAVYLLFCASESIQAVLFLFRNRPKEVATDVFSWFVALGGTFAALCFRPGGSVIWEGGEVVLAVGFILQIIALASLNRSFGLVAARREIKTNLAYHFVRHPMYASYVVANIGYLLFNASMLNALCLLFVLSFFVLRIDAEEDLLSRDSRYAAYKHQVKYRLIPFVY